MPADHNHKRLGTDWVKNATTLWGFPLHPLGEMAAVDFIMAYTDDIALMRTRLTSMQLQVAFNVTASCIFASNFYISAKMVIARPRALNGWCCLIPSILGIGMGVLTGMMVSPFNVSCRDIIWYTVAGITITLVCNSIIVLQRAYLVLCRQRWVIIVGINPTCCHIKSNLELQTGQTSLH